MSDPQGTPGHELPAPASARGAEPVERADVADVADLIVGIDLGTTNSLVAICDHAGPRTLADRHGADMVPSVVRVVPALDGSGRYTAVVGREAKLAGIDHPETTIASIKRLVGRSLHDAADLPTLSYHVVEGARATARVRVPVEGHASLLLSPEALSAHILAELRAVAERALGVRVRKAVITVPAYFDDAQRQATRTAGRLAGLDVVRILPEPTAAALAYGIGLARESARNQRKISYVCVYDLGGGTFDISILRITPAFEASAIDFYQVLATHGDTRLGGDDLDSALAVMLAPGANLASMSPGARRALLDAAERAKRDLSEREETVASLGHGANTSGVDEPVPRDRTVTRREFEMLIAPLVEKTIRCCEVALREARSRGLPQGPAREVLDAVILVGGSTRVPFVRARVREFFGMEPYTAVDPDRAVALGAAVQASLLAGTTKGSLLLDVIPLSLGLGTAGGAVAKMIVRNSAVPARAVEMFSTGVDNQTGVQLAVYQGEREMAEDCRLLARFDLRGVPPMPAGLPQVEVTFLVDANGVLNVSAVERRSGKRAELQVVPNHGMTREEADAAERASFTHAREDMLRHRIADLASHASLDVSAIVRVLASHGAHITAEQRAEVEGAIGVVRGFLSRAGAGPANIDVNALALAKERLDRASVPLHEAAIRESLRGESLSG